MVVPQPPQSNLYHIPDPTYSLSPHTTTSPLRKFFPVKKTENGNSLYKCNDKNILPMVLFSLPYIMANQFPERTITLNDNELRIIYAFVIRVVTMNRDLKKADPSYDSDTAEIHLVRLMKILQCKISEMDEVLKEIMEIKI